MKIENFKDAVKLRTKKLSDGTESIFLDIYVDGKRKYEYLKLYLIPGKENRQRNKDTVQLANAIKAKRLIDIQNGRFGFDDKKESKKINLIDYFKELREEYKETKSKNFYYSCKSVIMHLEGYVGKKNVMLKDVDKKFVLGFLKYMKKTPTYRGVPLGPESIYTYYMHFCIGLNKAVKRELIDKNPCDSVPTEDKPKRAPSNRCFLTLEEVKLLIDTECKDIRVKRMFLFSCFTGLRYKDVSLLKWKNLKAAGDNLLQLEIIQQKTKQPLIVPLTENALHWMPNRYMEGEENRIFPMPETSMAYDYLHDWTKKAGITKNVTFHVARHTYATLLLYYGADLYTVSKLLGHTNIKTTQIYAKVMDESKRKAVNLIPEI